jgi:hypothetical protein
MVERAAEQQQRNQRVLCGRQVFAVESKDAEASLSTRIFALEAEPDSRGLVPGIHVLAELKQERRGWPGRSPAMTKKRKRFGAATPTRNGHYRADSALHLLPLSAAQRKWPDLLLARSGRE